MNKMVSPAAKEQIDVHLNFDVIIIGAGVAGLYQLHLMRQLGLSVKSFEAGSGVGGTWYWNRHLGF